MTCKRELDQLRTTAASSSDGDTPRSLALAVAFGLAMIWAAHLLAQLLDPTL